MTDYFTKNEIDEPRLSAEMILSYALELKRIELYMHFNRVIEKPTLDKLHHLIKRAAASEPIAYLVGRKEFYSLEIKVNSNCLIPRPETELLVERAIEFLRKRPAPRYVCDLCTGSGCIATAVAKGVDDIKIIATDICDAALSVAAENIEKHGLTDKVHLLCGDLFDPIIEGLDQTHFDLIISNPPYISTAEMAELDKNVKDYEPHKALHAGEEGLDVYKRIIAQANEHLKDDGAIMLEIGYKQAASVTELLEKTKCFKAVSVEKDPHGNDRIVKAIKQPRK
ncbi:MAG: peptide chain release factor N(5)-glutamine methyltransferase [Phycisphaerae bacterium]|nr:peptide chain release factor N(5)-glutamine methyltransferase [Phycisphaerae bacterium]